MRRTNVYADAKEQIVKGFSNTLKGANSNTQTSLPLACELNRQSCDRHVVHNGIMGDQNILPRLAVVSKRMITSLRAFGSNM
jgi:hypothetical protein